MTEKNGQGTPPVNEAEFMKPLNIAGQDEFSKDVGSKIQNFISTSIQGDRRGYYLGRSTVVKKSGKYTVNYGGLAKRRKNFVKDIYISLIDLKWRWALFTMAMIFAVSYLVFAVFWWLAAYIHGDFHNLDNENWKPCIEDLDSFAAALQFSIETQSTIGFGTIYPNPDCGGSIPLTYLQITFGFLLETIALGFIFVKLARPKNRRQTILFSKSACICREEGDMCFQVRIGDLRKTHLIECVVYGMMIREHVSEEGTHYPLYQFKMNFEVQNMEDRVHLIWPLILRHRINEDSPMWKMTPEEILSNYFEIVIYVEGTIESTGEMLQARTSFTSKDILWGYRFVPIESYDERKGYWNVDFNRFDDVIPAFTPKCSAKDLADLIRNKTDTKQQKSEDDGVTIRKTKSAASISQMSQTSALSIGAATNTSDDREALIHEK